MLVLFGYGRTWWLTPDYELGITETALGDNLTLRQDKGGWAGLYWEGVTILQRPRYLPFLQKTIYSIHMGDTDDCDEKQVRVTPDRAKKEVVVQCGLQHPYTVAHVKMP